jgi:hypothetical protein
MNWRMWAFGAARHIAPSPDSGAMTTVSSRCPREETASFGNTEMPSRARNELSNSCRIRTAEYAATGDYLDSVNGREYPRILAQETSPLRSRPNYVQHGAAKRRGVRESGRALSANLPTRAPRPPTRTDMVRTEAARGAPAKEKLQ